MKSDQPITADNAYERSRKNSLFEGLNKEQIAALFSISREMTLEKDGFLMREGDPAEEIYLILEGELEISRYDAKHRQNHTIATLKAGDTVGEVSLLDSGLRSASVCARSFCRLRGIAFRDLQALAERDHSLYSIFYHLSKNVGRRLRHSNDVALQAMERQLDEFKTRVTLGNFFVYIVIMLSLFTFSLDGLKYVMNVGKNSSYITLPLTLKNWQKALREGVVFTIPFALLIVGLKGFLISYVPGYEGRPLIEGLAAMDADPRTWWTFLFIYILIVAPLQEFLARGGLQGPLEEFLSSRYKVALAILVSNLLFSTMHLFMSLEIALLTFIPGVYFGWLYSRTHNLLGVWIAHALVGTIGLSLIGF
jgi:CRP-like cAMP-binding protein